MRLTLRDWARALKRDTLAVYLAMRDPRTPALAKALGVVVLAYALSPIDLIPDFIPVLGLIDDLILVPAGLWLVMRLIPPAVLAASRARAAEQSDRPVSRAGAIVVVALWIAAAAWVGSVILPFLQANK